MANQSLISVPPNVDDPLVLQRFLSRLVEQLDIVLGNRAGPNNQYVSQEELLTQATELTKLLQDAQDSLEQVLLRLEDTDVLIVEELLQRIIAVEQKNIEQDDRLDTIAAVAVIKGLMLTSTVDGLGEPDISVNFNINPSTATRISTGLYEFELVQTTFKGIDIIDNVVPTLSHVIAPSATSEIFQTELVSTGLSTTFRIQVNEFIVGVGGKLTIVPYNLVVGDIIAVSGLFNVPGSVLPT